MSKRLNSPVKYYGGKGNGVREVIYGHFPSKASYDMYLEPFGGSASVLLLKEQLGIEIYNDLESNVYSLFKVLSDKTLFPAFKEKCDLALYSRQLWNEYKQDLKGDISLLDRAFKYFYVNRTSFNGHGGFSVSTSIRRNMSKSTSDMLSTVDGLKQLHNRLSTVIIENTDGIELIKKWDKERVFMYLDPPYHTSTRTSARYIIDMNDKQQKELIDTLLAFKKATVLLSGYDCGEYKRLTKAGWTMVEFNVNTQDTKQKPKSKTEYLWKNYCSNLKAESLWE